MTLNYKQFRHDGDPYITRTKKEIVGYNVKVADLLQSAFRLDNNRTIPIVPCIGKFHILNSYTVY